MEYTTYKTIFGTVLVVSGIAFSIILLSVNHRRNVVEDAARVARPRSGLSLNVTSEATVTPVLRATRDNKEVTGGPCNIERIDGEVFGTTAHRTPKRVIAISGWLVDQATRSVPQSVSLAIDVAKGDSRAWTAAVTPSIDRPDVVKILGGNAAYRRSGFEVKLDRSVLADGEYRLQIRYSLDGRDFLCDNGRSIELDS
ncbi:MAG: hypothetical protein EPN56_04660 [Rhodanobacter sp.]|nr:MAG: hypothetical protein EPN56_04660 [Rhodanobacter sp.]